MRTRETMMCGLDDLRLHTSSSGLYETLFCMKRATCIM